MGHHDSHPALHYARSYEYEPDTVVSDVEELTMQVHVTDRWHRRTPDLASTACGEPIHSQFAALRREELSGDLCRECFTPYERAQAAETARQEREGT